MEAPQDLQNRVPPTHTPRQREHVTTRTGAELDDAMSSTGAPMIAGPWNDGGGGGSGAASGSEGASGGRASGNGGGTLRGRAPPSGLPACSTAASLGRARAVVEGSRDAPHVTQKW
jgi:hypothetical protein